MGKNKNRGPKVSSSLFAALPTELRNTFMANASKTVYVSPPTQDAAAATTGAAFIPPPPEVAVVVASTIASSPSLAPGGKKRKRVEPAAPAALPVVVSVKRRKPWTEEGGSTHPWDCTGMVTRYSRDKQVPKDLKKYFAQRTRLWSLYNELPILMDWDGWFSVTPERIAIQIAERLRCGTVLDAFCGVGGNTIAFAQTCERVIALDTSPTRLALARHNAFQYGVADRIEFILGDFVSFARSLSSTSSSSSSSDSSRKPLNGIDAVFLSPPWGGISYETLGTPSASTPSDTPVGPAIYPLAALQPLHGKELFDLARSITDDVGYYLPRNVDLEEVRALVGEEERVEVEEEIMGGKIKALTCLFGGLAGRR